MARPAPIGFLTNFRTFSFVSNDGSGFTFFRKASFSISDGSLHKLYAGASIASTSEAASCVIVTDEPHGYHDQQDVYIHGLPGAVGTACNGLQTITLINATSFSIPVDTLTGTLGTTAGVGLTGVDIEARIPVLNYCIVPGDLCVNDHPTSWEMPLVG